MSKEVAEEYASSLADLTVNSKPLINMLTILAEENIDHAGVIVETVEKHLEKVHPDIKLPVLYLVDSIIKNVGGAYTQKFSQIIVNMFTKTFKQVDEKIRSQMFKLRETWHDVFPATKLYQLDVKVNLIDPAWPIQAQPQQSNIHVNPNFLKKPVATTSTTAPLSEEEEKMRNILAKKEQELLMLQRKKIEMELEQTRRQLEMAEKNNKKVPSGMPSPSMPVAMVNPVVAPVLTPAVASVVAPAVASAVAPAAPPAAPPVPEVNNVSVKQRLGPPVNKSPSSGRIAPVTGALATARRDPRLQRHAPAPHAPAPHAPAPHAPHAPPAPIAPNVFDIKPLERVAKRKNVITIDVHADAAEAVQAVQAEPRAARRRDPRLDKRAPADKRADRADRADRQSDKRRDRDRSQSQRTDDRDDRPKATDRSPPATAPPAAAPSAAAPPAAAVATPPAPAATTTTATAAEKSSDSYLDKLLAVDPKKITKLPPIPKLVREEVRGARGARAGPPAPGKRRKEPVVRADKKKKRDSGKDSSSGSSPEKKPRARDERRQRAKEQRMEVDEKPTEPEVVAFKELKNYHREHYMRRNKEKSESPERITEEKEEPKPTTVNDSNIPDIIVENKDIDLRVLHPVVTEPKAVVSVQKRSSPDIAENKPKKNKLDKFDILFGNEDVDLRQLPQVEEICAPPPPSITSSPKPEVKTSEELENSQDSSRNNWNEIKEKGDEVKKTPTQLDLVRAKLAEATKGKDRLGRPLLFSKSASEERERRRTSSEDIDLRPDGGDDFAAENHKKAISIIVTHAKEQYSDGKMDKNQYNTLMYQVVQLNEQLKLKEAKQRESLEMSKRKLKAHSEDNHKVPSPKTSPKEHNKYGDIDERRQPAAFMDAPPDNCSNYGQDSDMRLNTLPNDIVDHPKPSKGLLPRPPLLPMYVGPYHPVWRGQHRPRMDEYGPRRMRGPVPPYFRGKFDKRAPRPPFDPRMPMPLPTPKMGMCQGECPLIPYERTSSPPPLGANGVIIPPTDFKVLEYIDQDPVKSIQIDGISREIRYYGETAIIMLDWDDPREIKFLPGSRRVTFDNKDSIMLSFNEGYKQVEIDDQVFEIRFGAPTRELYINGRWYECFFGGQPLGVIIDGKPRLIHLEGPLPQVDIGKTKRTDLVAGKINLIIDATHMCSVFLDAKIQKFLINGMFFTIRFVDALRTVLINEQPFKVEFGGLPKPIYLSNEKHFIRFSVLPRHVKPGHVQIANMEGSGVVVVKTIQPFDNATMNTTDNGMEIDLESVPRPNKTPSPEGESQGLDMLASVMPSTMAPASSSEYTLAEPLFSKPDKIPGLETPSEEKPSTSTLPILGNINVNDLFAKLVASGIVQTLSETKKEEPKTEEVKPKPKEDKNVIHPVDLMKPETLRVRQGGLVARLYGGMQCSGCGARFPPEHTVRYSQHLDWHFRQNRRERDSARRAHSRHWHYDLSDWVQYEEIEDLEEREKSWFETSGAEGEGEAAGEAAEEAPSVPAGAPTDHHCALCGDKFDQFYNEDKEEWHLRKAVRHEDNNYHPLCFEDYKASLVKGEPANESVEEVPVEKIEEAIEIKDLDESHDQSDNESVVEVVEPEEQEAPEPVEIDEGDEDDVVFKAEPVVQVVVDDDGDTDDETVAERAERDRLAEIDFSKVKIKQEPIDPDDEPIITAEVEAAPVAVDSAPASHTSVLSTIDGNVQLDAAPAPAAALPAGGIRINISKPPPAPAAAHTTAAAHTAAPTAAHAPTAARLVADDEPLPPGEEPDLHYRLKPTLEGVHFSRQPPVQRGNELSALCSIM